MGCLCSADCTIANHVGDKNGAKAEGGSATGGVKVVTDSSVGVTVDVSEEIRINKDDTGAIVPGTLKKQYIC